MKKHPHDEKEILKRQKMTDNQDDKKKYAS